MFIRHLLNTAKTCLFAANVLEHLCKKPCLFCTLMLKYLEESAKPFELAPVDDLLNDPIEEEIEIPAAPVPVPAAPSKSAKLPITNPPPAVKKTTKKPSAKKTRKN